MTDKDSLILSIQCMVCNSIVEDDHYVCDSRGAHRICTNCYPKTNTTLCSVCKGPLKLKYDALIAQICAVLELERRCKYSHAGCNVSLLQKNYDNNVKNCKCVFTPCHNQLCKHVFKHNDTIQTQIEHMVKKHNLTKVAYGSNIIFNDRSTYIMPLNDDMFLIAKTYRDDAIGVYFSVPLRIHIKLFFRHTTTEKKDSYTISYHSGDLVMTKEKYYQSSHVFAYTSKKDSSTTLKLKTEEVTETVT